MIQELIGKELPKSVQKKFLKYVLIGWFLLVVLTTNLISKKWQNNLSSFQYQINLSIQVIFIRGHGVFHLGQSLNMINLKRKCLTHKHLLGQREFHFYWVNLVTIIKTFLGTISFNIWKSTILISLTGAVMDLKE